MAQQLDWQTTEPGLRADAGPIGIWTIAPWHEQFILKGPADGQWGGTIHDTVDLAKEYLQNVVNDAENPVPPRKTGYTLDDFAAILKGDVPLPNIQQVRSLAEGVNNIAALGHSLQAQWGYSHRDDGHKVWTQYFLSVYDGSGYAMIYGMNAGSIVRFSICRHQKKMHPGANPSRGWHPGHCIKCGLDMTVDSSD